MQPLFLQLLCVALLGLEIFRPHYGTQLRHRHPGGLSDLGWRSLPGHPQSSLLRHSRGTGCREPGCTRLRAAELLALGPCLLLSHALSHHQTLAVELQGQTCSPNAGTDVSARHRDRHVRQTQGQTCLLSVAPPEGSAEAPSLLGTVDQ